MIALLFDVAGQQYGLDISQVLEVVPAVRVRHLAGVPEYVAGVFRFRGAYVPVIDLSRLIGGTPAAARLSTRMVLVRYPVPGRDARILGLLAEHAAEGLDDSQGVPSPTGIAAPDAPYLGTISTSGRRTVQYVRVEQLLPEALRERLFTESQEA
jgi:chemotaxis-related protein WspB